MLPNQRGRYLVSRFVGGVMVHRERSMVGSCRYEDLKCKDLRFFSFNVLQHKCKSNRNQGVNCHHT